MEILGKELTNPVAEFIERSLPIIQEAYDRPLDWEWSAKLPEGFQAQYSMGADGQPVIYVRKPKREGLFGLVVAHEVAHVLLTLEGFPRAQSASAYDPRLGLVFYNTILDTAVNTRLASEHILSESLERLLFAHVIGGLFDKGVHEPASTDIANSGLWALTFSTILLKDGLGLSNEFVRILRGRYSGTLRRAVALTSEIRGAGLEDPAGCVRAMEIARERLRLEQAILIEASASAPAESGPESE